MTVVGEHGRSAKGQRVNLLHSFRAVALSTPSQLNASEVPPAAASFLVGSARLYFGRSVVASRFYARAQLIPVLWSPCSRFSSRRRRFRGAVPSRSKAGPWPLRIAARGGDIIGRITLEGLRPIRVLSTTALPHPAQDRPQ
jgi:hypothetical protein